MTDETPELMTPDQVDAELAVHSQALATYCGKAGYSFMLAGVLFVHDEDQPGGHRIVRFGPDEPIPDGVVVVSSVQAHYEDMTIRALDDWISRAKEQFVKENFEHHVISISGPEDVTKLMEMLSSLSSPPSPPSSASSALSPDDEQS